MRRILCLWLPNWSIQRLLGGRSRVHKRSAMHQPEKVHFASLMHPTPILLHARDPRRGELIAACNAAAEERGVRLGMPLAEAAALAGVAKDGTRSVPATLPHDPAADQAALARLAEHCERFSPLVGWRTVEDSGFRVQGSEAREQGTGNRGQGTEDGADCLFLDVTGIGVLFGGEEALAREVVAEMSRIGYEARVAIAQTIGAAWAGAQMQNAECGMQNGEQVKPYSVPSTQYLALSTQRDTPDSRLPTPDSRPLFRIPHSAFRICPLSALRLSPETLDLLSQLGVTQLDQLLALPRESLRARFGERLLLRIDQFFGTAQETIVAHRPPPRFAAEWVLEYPAERRDVIEQIVRELVSRVARDLAGRREGAVQLDCRLDCAPGQPLLLTVGLFRPSAEAEHLWDLVRMQLEQAAQHCCRRAALCGPVGRITLAARLTAPLENRQGELFAGGEHQAQRQLEMFIDRCTSRLGPDAVLRPELTADPLPEKAVKLMRSAEFGMRSRSRSKVQGPKSKVRRRSAAALHSAFRIPHSAFERPLTLHNPPLPLDVLSVIPDGPPMLFDQGDHRHKVIHHWGPERIETGWWRGRSIRRDYWRVETASGQRFWLFRSLNDGKWHLHGEFS
jgi:protein ImuB